MKYADITFNDTNPIKRWLQHSRLRSAIKGAIPYLNCSQIICDFGSGNGELLKHLRQSGINSKLVCYEPTPQPHDEAKLNLAKFSDVDFYSRTQDIPEGSIDILFCLEVFEHLPQKEMEEAIKAINRVTTDKPCIIFGVPVEIRFPALYKGLFRRFRRRGSFDTNLRNIIACFKGSPPKPRPILEITPGFDYHFEHTGFDYRDFALKLSEEYEVKNVFCSPFSCLGPSTMPEIYFLVTKLDANTTRLTSSIRAF